MSVDVVVVLDLFFLRLAISVDFDGLLRTGVQLPLILN